MQRPRILVHVWLDLPPVEDLFNTKEDVAREIEQALVGAMPDRNASASATLIEYERGE